jgi:arginine-tRNA-protein transferase
MSQMRAFYVDSFSPRLYHDFMDAGFRRSGEVIYQPICRGCRACLPMRVPVDRFRESKSQRRCRRRNADLSVSVTDAPVATDEKFELYRKYLSDWHETPPAEDDRQSFESFLYDSPVRTIEFAYRDAGGRLVGVGICDVCLEKSLSSVYFYHDPAEFKRGVGTYGVLCEIDFAIRCSIPYYYLGYWVKGCAAMEYKASFRPCQVLQPDGSWQAAAAESAI